MSITEISVKRPTAIIIIIALLIGLGVMGYTRLGSDLLPSMDIPIMTISTSYNGAGADQIKKDITKPVEDSISGISGVDTISSTAKEGVSTTVVRFKVDTDMNSAFLDVQKAVDNLSAKLPKDADKPVLYKLDTSMIPALIITITGNVPYDELYNQADKVKKTLEKTSGVGNVTIDGAQKKQLMVKLDKPAVEYYGVNVNSILNKLKSDNVNMPLGQIKEDKNTQTVRAMAQFNSIDDVKNLIIPTSGGASSMGAGAPSMGAQDGSIRLSDIAQVSMGYPDANEILRLNGHNAIGVEVQKQSDANVVKTVDNAKEALNTINKQLPPGVKVTVAGDTTTYIRTALKDIQHRLIEGIITTAIVLLLFLKSWRSSLVVLIAIPTALISTFFMMYVCHFTLNMMSLMGLTLCIGILVDDSIVILENIQRHLAKGEDPVTAAIEGRREIGLAAISITLCDVVVFTPVAFMSGMIGKYFKEFGLTITFASLFSLFVSFTVTPMLASRLFKSKNVYSKKDKASRLKNNPIFKVMGGISKLIDKWVQSYKKLLVWSLENRAKVLITTCLLIALSIALIPMGAIKTEAMPQSDESQFYVNVSLTPGSNLKQTDQKVQIVENHLKSMKDVKSFYSIMGNNTNPSSSQSSATIVVKLKPIDERKKSQSDIAADLRKWGNQIPGIKFIVSESQMGGGGSASKPISINVEGDDYENLKEISSKVEELVESVPGITDIENSSNDNSTEIRVKVDKLAAATYGVSLPDISAVLRTGINGSTAGTYTVGSDDYDINVKFMDGQVKTPQDIGSIKILSSSGQLVDLNQIAYIENADSPVEVSREDRQDVITISANIEGKTLGEVNSQIKNKLKSLHIPSGYEIKFGGNQKEMIDSFTSLIKALAVSIVLVYMVLVVLYESFLTPAVRMLALPCAVIGALGILAITGKTLSIPTMIGVIMLDGLASKNGTLLIDYTNTLMKRGLNLKDALLEAGTTRLRPIIMTTATMIVGMLPSAISTGEGSELSGMSCLIIGGMITSTILTPILLPVVYTLLEDFKHWIRRKLTGGNKEVSQYEN
ncbi:efflux RND transporter permease subunit [Clostridium sp. JN-1]|uniref:efflux RND transporter permease subunit n=1 Tax=Clostridium sp. JN-1 TaxID=2483110 RepID=UPI000F0BAB11|nr:efflux RND transporter permease subunit [Clostridium sp. JN-1]